MTEAVTPNLEKVAKVPTTVHWPLDEYRAAQALQKKLGLTWRDINRLAIQSLAKKNGVEWPDR